MSGHGASLMIAAALPRCATRKTLTGSACQMTCPSRSGACSSAARLLTARRGRQRVSFATGCAPRASYLRAAASTSFSRTRGRARVTRPLQQLCTGLFTPITAACGSTLHKWATRCLIRCARAWPQAPSLSCSCRGTMHRGATACSNFAQLKKKTSPLSLCLWSLTSPGGQAQSRGRLLSKRWPPPLTQ